MSHVNYWRRQRNGCFHRFRQKHCCCHANQNRWTRSGCQSDCRHAATIRGAGRSSAVSSLASRIATVTDASLLSSPRLRLVLAGAGRSSAVSSLGARIAAVTGASLLSSGHLRLVLTCIRLTGRHRVAASRAAVFLRCGLVRVRSSGAVLRIVLPALPFAPPLLFTLLTF